MIARSVPHRGPVGRPTPNDRPIGPPMSTDEPGGRHSAGPRPRPRVTRASAKRAIAEYIEAFYDTAAFRTPARARFSSRRRDVPRRRDDAWRRAAPQQGGRLRIDSDASRCGSEGAPTSSREPVRKQPILVVDADHSARLLSAAASTHGRTRRRSSRLTTITSCDRHVGSSPMSPFEGPCWNRRLTPRGDMERCAVEHSWVPKSRVRGQSA